MSGEQLRLIVWELFGPRSESRPTVADPVGRAGDLSGASPPAGWL